MPGPSPAIISYSASVATSGVCAVSMPNDGVNFWFCSGFEITAGGATAAQLNTATITGLLGGTLSYKFGVPAGVSSPATPLQVSFPSALAAASVGADVVLSVAGFAGNLGVCAVIHGYKGSRQYNQ